MSTVIHWSPDGGPAICDRRLKGQGQPNTDKTTCKRCQKSAHFKADVRRGGPLVCSACGSSARHHLAYVLEHGLCIC